MRIETTNDGIVRGTHRFNELRHFHQLTVTTQKDASCVPPPQSNRFVRREGAGWAAVESDTF